jgi:hypothetical protein
MSRAAGRGVRGGEGGFVPRAGPGGGVFPLGSLPELATGRGFVLDTLFEDVFGFKTEGFGVGALPLPLLPDSKSPGLGL